MASLVPEEIRLRRLTIAAVVAALLLGALVPGVVAAEERSGGTVVVAEGETVDGDLQAYGGQVIVRGTVDGDLQVFAGQVDVTGEVTGDVEIFGGNVRLAGDVGGDVEAFAGTVAVERQARLAGALSVGAGNVVVDGRVDGPARLSAGTVSLGANARIGGDLTYDGELSRDPDAEVAGSVTRDEELEVGGGSPVGGDVPPVVDWLLSVYGLLVNLLFGVILLVVLPRFSDRVAQGVIDEPLRSGGAGLLAAVGIPVALVLLAVTLVGLPLSLLGAVLFVLVAWAAGVYGRFALGTWLLSFTGRGGRYAALLVGLLAAFLVGQVPIAGELFGWLLSVLGLGAISLAVVRRARSRREETDGAESAGAGGA